MIYFDHSATSWPKAPGVGKAMSDFLEHTGCNVGRGGYERAYQAEEAVYQVRDLLCRLFNGKDNSHVIVTSGVTEALNMVIKGILQPGDHVLVSPMEHNAVMRPLESLKRAGIQYTVFHADKDGVIITEKIEEAIRPNTRLAIINHGSNVNGCLQPIDKIGQVLKKHKIFFAVDAAQTAGLIEIDCQRDGIDALCFTGHKGLLGPQGTGGIILSEQMAQAMQPVCEGGTGSFSELYTMPEVLPDRFEAGTLNLPGIIGLGTAVKYLLKTDYQKIYQREMALTKIFVESAVSISRIKIIQPKNHALPVVSLCGIDKDNAIIAYELDRRAQIMTRVGLHCAPLAHQTLGTYPQGTIRFSFGHLNTETEIDQTIKRLKEIVSET